MKNLKMGEGSGGEVVDAVGGDGGSGAVARGGGSGSGGAGGSRGGGSDAAAAAQSVVLNKKKRKNRKTRTLRGLPSMKLGLRAPAFDEFVSDDESEVKAHIQLFYICLLSLYHRALRCGGTVYDMAD